MTIDKAIVDLSIQLAVKQRLEWNYQRDALRLGIEALKRIKECRSADHLIREDLLPGETEE